MAKMARMKMKNKDVNRKKPTNGIMKMFIKDVAKVGH